MLAAGIARVSGQAPANLVGVTNRDLEGSVVLDADEAGNYLDTAAQCRDQCANNTECNLWVYCPATAGCTSGGTNQYDKDLRRYRQCWLKYDKPSNRTTWPRSKNSRDQDTGWLSGTTQQGFADAAGPDTTYSDCTCDTYTVGGKQFLGVCANYDGTYAKCQVVASGCRYPPSSGEDSCSGTHQCTVTLDTQYNGDVLIAGDDNYQDSPDDCCSQCATTTNCNTWAWCGSISGCDGKLQSFRQCWLQAGDARNPSPKDGYGNSKGWIGGVRGAFIPA